MKHFLAVLLCLLLCGCGQQASPALPETEPEAPAVPVMAGLYDPNHPIEQTYPGLVRAYPLTLRKVQGIYAFGNDVLVLSGYGNTTLTLFTGEQLQEIASLTLDFQLQQDDASFQIHENTISFFHPEQRETIVLDRCLRQLRRISLPDELSGSPILSPKADTLYYCTGWSVVAWDLESGIRRTVKELSYDHQELTALHLDGQILECSIQHDGMTTKLLLSADQGLEIGSLPEDAVLTTGGSTYFTAMVSGYQTLLIFGDSETAPELLLPDQLWQQQFYLPEDHSAVTVASSGDGTRLDYYELNTGILRSSLTLPQLQTPKSIGNTRGHCVYILAYDPEADCDILYRWDVLRQKPDPGNTATYTAAYRPAEDPDEQALGACQEYARAIGEKYGITLRIGEDALAVQPWDYSFQPEHLAPILEKELKLLDQRLEQYPKTVLEQTKSHFTNLTLCLVRSINGTGDSQSLSSATGIQFFRDNEAFVVITTGKHSQQALYHELYHVMQTHILTESTALDVWETLNPAGFVYGDSHPDADIYLQGQTRAFADRYSMGALKEDQARILENAMLQGKKTLFQSEYMQRKLTALCTGIREAYRLKDHPDILPWEQYLVTPLIPEQ